MKKAKEEKVIGIAFWKYDLFPYILSAPFTRLEGAYVYCPSYQSKFTPLFILDEETGMKLGDELNSLRYAYQQATGNLHSEFQVKRHELIKKFGGKIS